MTMEIDVARTVRAMGGGRTSEGSVTVQGAGKRAAAARVRRTLPFSLRHPLSSVSSSTARAPGRKMSDAAADDKRPPSGLRGRATRGGRGAKASEPAADPAADDGDDNAGDDASGVGAAWKVELESIMQVCRRCARTGLFQNVQLANNRGPCHDTLAHSARNESCARAHQKVGLRVVLPLTAPNPFHAALSRGLTQRWWRRSNRTSRR